MYRDVFEIKPRSVPAQSPLVTGTFFSVVGNWHRFSRSRVCQMLNLLDLNDTILKELMSIENVKEHNFFTEHRLRNLALMETGSQLTEFSRLREASAQWFNLGERSLSVRDKTPKRYWASCLLRCHTNNLIFVKTLLMHSSAKKNGILLS